MTEPTPATPGTAAPAPLLGASDIRRLAEEMGVRPAKTLGQNFVIDGNTIRRIVSVADVHADETVLEVGPGPRLTDVGAAGRSQGRCRRRNRSRAGWATCLTP